MKHNNKALTATVGLFGILIGGNATAVDFQTFAAANVSYTLDVDALGPFGTASLVGENLVFTPTSFVATAGSAPAATKTINVTVTALSGYQLTAFNLQEQGGYNLNGGTAYLSGSLKALDVEGNTQNIVQNSLVSSMANNAWTASAGVSIPVSGWGGADGIVNSVSLTLSNQLFASGGAATIYKDLVTLSSTYTAVTPVPEAENYALMLVGLGLVGFMVRRARVVV